MQIKVDIVARGSHEQVAQLLRRCIDELEDNEATDFTFAADGQRVEMLVSDYEAPVYAK